VGVRAHYLIDLPLGWLTAELILYAVFYPLERRRAFQWAKALSVRALAVLALLPVALYASYLYLHHLADWTGTLIAPSSGDKP
jgi:hypothetical protein